MREAYCKPRDALSAGVSPSSVGSRRIPTASSPAIIIIAATTTVARARRESTVGHGGGSVGPRGVKGQSCACVERIERTKANIKYHTQSKKVSG